jgi:hypothetical protein
MRQSHNPYRQAFYQQLFKFFSSIASASRLKVHNLVNNWEQPALVAAH